MGKIIKLMKKNSSESFTTEELAQETLIALWRNAGKFNPAQASASTWIYTIARNKRVDMIRKTSRRREEATEFLPDTLEDGAVPVDQQVILNDQSQRIRRVIETLPGDQADMIYKSYFEGLTHAEIAAKTDIPLGTVKSRLRLAMDRLRHAVGNGNMNGNKGLN